MDEKIPLILLPGMLCDGALWQPQIESLADLVTPQIADLTQDDTIEGMAARILANAPASFALAGLSMGGYVAQEILRQAPARVLRLALLDSSARADTPDQASKRRGTIELSEKGEFHGVTQRLLPFLLHPKHLSDNALTGTVMGMTSRVGKLAFQRQQTALIGRRDGRQDLTRIACPTLILCGREDAMTPPKLHQEMADLVPSARLAIVEECGHLSTLEQPQAVNAELRTWLMTQE